MVLAYPLRVGQAVRLVCHGGRLSGPVCPEQTHFTPFGGRPRARAEPSMRIRIAGGFCGRAQRGHRLMSLQQDMAAQMAAVSMAIYEKPSC